MWTKMHNLLPSAMNNIRAYVDIPMTLLIVTLVLLNVHFLFHMQSTSNYPDHSLSTFIKKSHKYYNTSH